MYRISYWLKQDGSRLILKNSDFVGNGGAGLVLHQGDNVLKIPRLSTTPGQSAEDAEHQEHSNKYSVLSMEREKDAYKRVGRHPGIVKPISLSDEGILLPYYPKGDLERYMDKYDPPDILMRQKWFMSVIETMCYIHQRKILVEDLALRNFLLADDMSIKMIDFGNCSVLPLDADLALFDEDGLNLRTEIFNLGCLLYSVAEWVKYEFCLYETQHQPPPLHQLPSLTNVWLGDVIKKCWTSTYSDVHQLRRDALNMCGDPARRTCGKPDAAKN
ncbi:MAG: hypothetical protein Q9170_001953 [Blastenia crenularia]